MTTVRAAPSETSSYREEDDETLKKYKKFAHVSVELSMRNFLTDGGEVLWQHFLTQRNFASSDELNNYNDYVSKLAVKWETSKKDHRIVITSNELILLGSAYARGKGVALSYEYAFQCYTQAKNINPLALHQLGMLFWLRKDEKQSSEVAIYFFEKAKEKGIASGAWALGRMHFRGDGIVKNIDKAFCHFMFAFEMNFPAVYLDLASFFQLEIFNEREYKKYLVMAVESGDPTALAKLAQVYDPNYKEFVTQKEVLRARTYYQYAGASGINFALNDLAYSFIEREPYNLYEAIKLFRRGLETPDNEMVTLSICNLRDRMRFRLMYASGLLKIALKRDWDNQDFRDWCTILYHVCAAYDITDTSYKPALLSSFFKFLLSHLSWKAYHIYKDTSAWVQVLKNKINLLVKDRPEFFADLICQEEHPEIVIKSLTYWIGNGIQKILNQKSIQDKLAEQSLNKSLPEIESYIHDSIFDGTPNLARIVTGYLSNSFFKQTPHQSIVRKPEAKSISFSR